VLGAVTDPATVHQAKFSMPATLGLIAVHGRAGMAEYDAFFGDMQARAFNQRVHMRLDPEVDAAYPARWIGKVAVETHDGRILAARVDEPKGDPGNTLSHDEIDGKARRLIAYGGGVEAAAVDGVMARLWGIAEADRVGRIL
jgi:2-methylcitrate dehydratase PrpD